MASAARRAGRAATDACGPVIGAALASAMLGDAVMTRIDGRH